jgi:DNA-binding MarR family transcriptional regulator
LVKKIDDIAYPPLEDHIGVKLWNVAELWKHQFDAAMIELGYGYFAEARSQILRYVGPQGTRQSKIVRRMGMTKQAVQQLVDELEADGVVRRASDKNDARGKIVLLAPKGIAALQDANRVKRDLQRRWSQRLGSGNMMTLMRWLEELADADQ